jgi:hypothetical protein
MISSIPNLPRDFIEYVAGDWGYYAETHIENPRYEYMSDVYGRSRPIAVMSGYRSVKHFAVDLTDHASWQVTIPICIQVFGDRSRFEERKLTPMEFEMLVFLNFPHVSEEELNHLIWAADEYEIALVPEKRDMLLIAAKLSQD